MQNICINRKGKQRKSSVRRGARKELDQKEQKRLLLLGIEPCTTCKHGLLTHIRSYGHLWLRNRLSGSVSYTVPDIRRIENTAYIRSYGLGQPYIYGVTYGTLAGKSPYIGSYTVQIYSSGQPHVRNLCARNWVGFGRRPNPDGLRTNLK